MIKFLSMKIIVAILVFLIGFNVQGQTEKEIVEKRISEASKLFLFSQDYQLALDAILKDHPRSAYAWQQKAMPLFKQGKYEIAMPILDKAVHLDPKQYMDYRAFMKCIFSKNYTEAIKDFEAAKAISGNSYVMDHTYDFYIALCYLQLGKFSEAEKILEIDREALETKGGVEAHFLDVFYLGIAKYELGKFEAAVTEFDKALQTYPEFSDAEYYKFLCLHKLGRSKEADVLLRKAIADYKNGFTINEDNAIYERYPYQAYFLKLW